MQEVQGKCIVHVSQQEPNVKGLDEMILTETDDAEGEEDEEGELVDKRKESKPSFDEGDGELIERRIERKEAVDEVEALPDDDGNEEHTNSTNHQHPSNPVTISPSMPTQPSKQKTELGDDDGEIINMPSSFSPG